MSEIHIAIDIPPVLTGSPIPVTVNLRLTALEEQVGVTGSTDPLSVENRITVAQEDIVTAQDTIDEHIADVANPHNVTKAQVGLGNVDNTSDINKPVSTAQAAADAAVLAASEPEGASAAAVSAHAGGTGVHAIQAVTGLQTALDGKSSTSHNHTGVYDLAGSASAAQAASAPAAKGVTGGDSHSHDYSTLSNKPTLGSAAALDVGTTANKVVQLDGLARMPAVDGSLLTGISGGGGSTQAFGTISVSGQSNVVADSAPDTLTIVGVGAVITTDASTDTITITAEAAGAAASAQAAAIAAAAADATSKANAAQAASAPAAKGVTNGDSHDHSGGDGAPIAGVLSGLTSGSVLFANGPSSAGQNNSNLFWDNSNARLGLCTSSPVAKLSIQSSSVLSESAQTSINNFVGGGIRIDGSSGGGCQDAITWQSAGGGGAAIAFRRDSGYGTSIDFYTNNSAVSRAIQFAMTITKSGKIGVATNNPTANLHVYSGTASVGGAPIKITAGTVTTAPESGAIEFDGTDLFFTGNALLRMPIMRQVLTKATSTSSDVPLASIIPSWTNGTHATRRGRLDIGVYDYSDLRTAISIETSGTAVKIGAYGVTAVIRPAPITAQLTTITHTAPGTPDYAIADVTQTTPFGFTTADEAHTILSVIKNLQDRVGQMETKLQGLGLLT